LLFVLPALSAFGLDSFMIVVPLSPKGGGSVLQAGGSRVNHNVVNTAARRLGKEPFRSAGNATCVISGNTRAHWLVRAFRAERQMRSIGKYQRDHSAKNAKPSLVCIIDDDPWSREGMSCYLESQGYDCAAFSTAEE
jgi:hypothetical protein